MTIKQAFALVSGCEIEDDAILTIRTKPQPGSDFREEIHYVQVLGDDWKEFKSDKGWVDSFVFPFTHILDVSEASAFANVDTLPEPIQSAVRIHFSA